MDAADDRLGLSQTQPGPYAFRRQGLSSSVIGAAPILGLIPVATTTSHPRLQVFGQPEIGHTLRFKVTRADPSPAPSSPNNAFLLYFLSPGAGSHQGCSVYVDPATAITVMAPTNTVGEANFNFAIPLDPAWLFSEWFFQAATPPSDRLSNGLVLRIGGGL